MAMNQITPVVKTKKGGGFLGGAIGKLAGAALGGVGGFLVGGPAGAAAGASLGASLGGTGGQVIGEKIKPTKQTQTKNVGVLQSMTKADPNVQLAILKNAQDQLKDMPLSATPVDSKAIVGHLRSAQEELKKRIQGEF